QASFRPRNSPRNRTSGLPLIYTCPPLLSNISRMSREQPFRVLFLQSDPLTAETRIRPLLDLLRSESHIGGYRVVDRDMAIGGDLAEHYDAILAHRNPSTRQLAWLRGNSARFAYDIDDLLLPGPAAKLTGRCAAESESIAWCLTNAHRVTAPSRR